MAGDKIHFRDGNTLSSKQRTFEEDLARIQKLPGFQNKVREGTKPSNGHGIYLKPAGEEETTRYPTAQELRDAEEKRKYQTLIDNIHKGQKPNESSRPLQFGNIPLHYSPRSRPPTPEVNSQLRSRPVSPDNDSRPHW